MKDTDVKNVESATQAEAEALFQQAKDDIAADMRSRDIGAIMWDNEQADFHFPPVVEVTDSEGKKTPWKIHGIYRVDDTLFLIGQGAAAGVENYYKPGIETRPVVVTLTEDQATRQLGIPNEGRGYTRQGDVQQWLSIADCYFEALTLNNDI